MVQFDAQRAMVPQIQAMLDALGLETTTGQAAPLAELHGRMGHFPAILRMRPVAESAVTQYEVAEVINLQALREQARKRR